MMGRLFLLNLSVLVCVSSLGAQPASPAASVPRPEAIYTPMPVYRPEWAKQGLTGKGVVLVTIDNKTGKVTGARMLESTGSQLLDGSALQAYSQWRFKPGTVSQLRMPIEFTNRPKPQTAKPTPSKPANLYSLLFLLVLAGAAFAFAKRRKPIT
jgi:TonB family protein